MLRFFLTSLGCKVNQYDGAALSAALTSAGLEPADRGASCVCGRNQACDLVVVNTCCVTTSAMRKSRQAIRRAVRNHPGCTVLVVGCYSDYHAGGIRSLLAAVGVDPHKTVVAGHHDDLSACVRHLADVLKTRTRRAAQPLPCRPDDESRLGRMNQDIAVGWDNQSMRSLSVLPCPRNKALPNTDSIRTRRQIAVKHKAPGTRCLGPIRRFGDHQRAFVKVQDGCDAFCAYCIVPYTRSVVWSRSIEQVERECRTLAAAGHKEIVLCGVFLGAFGRNTAIRRRWGRQPSALPRLLGRIAAIRDLWRVRLSSLEPGDLTDELLNVFGECPKVAPHLHLPLQSGSQRILRRMNRQYTPDDYRRTVDRLRAALDRPAITTDIIVGFPGETDADFAETLAIARYAGFSKIHAFPFSAIRGTAAWTRRGEAPPPDVVKRRIATLAELERRLAEDYRRLFIGQTLEGLVEGGESSRTSRAMTDRYLRICFKDRAARPGQIVNLRITDLRPDGMSGEVVQT